METDRAVATTRAAPAGATPRRERRPKQGNSEKFNKLLSEANELSGSERIRLIKSLAGQAGFICIKPTGSSQNSARREAKPRVPRANNVRPNPLRGTKYDVELELARQALREAKDGAGGALLSQDHPAILGYKKALEAYKAAKSQLAVVDTARVPKRDRADDQSVASTPGAKPQKKQSVRGRIVASAKGAANAVASVLPGTSSSGQL